MTRTPTLPLDDPKMWRQAIAAAHPDRGGSHELCIWMQHLRETVLRDGTMTSTSKQGARPREQYRHPYAGSGDPARVPFPSFGTGSDFAALTDRALAMAEEVGGVHGALLEMLTDCYPLARLAHEQERGASYKRLAAAAHKVGMTKAARVRWYRIAEAVPLSDRHVGHILSRLDRRAA